MKRESKLVQFMKAAAFTGAMSISVGAGLTYASMGSDFGNDTTGPDSYNKNEVELSSDIDIDIENDSEADNDFDFESETGDNDISCNTTVDGLETGSVEVTADFENVLNENSIEGFELSNDWFNFGDFNGSNELTGPYSYNKNTVEIDQDMDIDIDNDADIDNDYDFDASTGDNDIRNNTTVGDITTGDIRFNADIENAANQNAMIDLSDLNVNNDINADFSNELTGPDSYNKNELEIDNNIDVDINNNASISNDIDIDAETGDNDISHNTCVGDVTTGDVVVSISGVNKAN